MYRFSHLSRWPCPSYHQMLLGKCERLFQRGLTGGFYLNIHLWSASRRPDGPVSAIMAASQHRQRYQKSRPLGQALNNLPWLLYVSIIHPLIKDSDLSFQCCPPSTPGGLHVIFESSYFFIYSFLGSFGIGVYMVLWWSSFVGVITSQPDQHCLYLGTLKTCIAITSLRTTSTSRDWACKLLTSSPRAFSLTYVL